MTRSQRAVRWLQPGLVVKRWVLTSGLGLLMAMLPLFYNVLHKVLLALERDLFALVDFMG